MSVFTPTSFTDSFDASAPSNQPISLRDAIIDANNDTGTTTDTIVLQSGTYSLNLNNPAGPRQNFLSHTGELDITNTKHVLIIQGAGSSGAGATIIDATALRDRVFHLVGAGVQVVFQNLAIQGGTARDNGRLGTAVNTSTATGGGILDDAGTLTLTNVTITGAAALAGPAQAAQGGGVFVGGGTARLTGTTLSNDRAIGGAGANAAFTSNAGNAGAGGAGQGGGLFASAGTLSLQSDVFNSDTATGGDGGVAIFNGGNGGAGGLGQGGGLAASGGTLSLVSDTFSSDTATGGRGGFGGDAHIFSGGNGGNGGGGGAGQGGGLFAGGPATITIASSTFSSDRATGGRGGFGGTAALNGVRGGVGGAGGSGPGRRPP